MTSDRFFIREDQVRFPHVILDEDEHHHLARVARIQEGDTVWLFDGAGQRHKARVREVTPEQTRLYILESQQASMPARRITLAFAVLKARAMDWLLQKATELGAAAFVPVITARTVVRLSAAEESFHKLERWNRIIREAAKQSGRSHVPTVSPPDALDRFLERDRPSSSLFLFEHAERELRDMFPRGIFAPQSGEDRDAQDDVLILVGPEGGWTNAEAMDILERGFEAVSLGDNVLRAETAALCTLAVLNQFWK